MKHRWFMEMARDVYRPERIVIKGRTTIFYFTLGAVAVRKGENDTFDLNSAYCAALAKLINYTNSHIKKMLTEVPIDGDIPKEPILETQSKSMDILSSDAETFKEDAKMKEILPQFEDIKTEVIDDIPTEEEQTEGLPFVTVPEKPKHPKGSKNKAKGESVAEEPKESGKRVCVPLSEFEKQSIKDLFMAGWSSNAIAIDLNRPRPTVYSFINTHQAEWKNEYKIGATV